eukprot:231122_1
MAAQKQKGNDLTTEPTKSHMLRAAFTGNHDELLQILQQLHQQTLCGETIETEIMEYIQYSMDHFHPEISAIASTFFEPQTKYCVIQMESPKKDFPEGVYQTFKITQNLHDVVQFIMSQKLIQNVAMLKVSEYSIFPDKFDTLLGEFEDESNNNNDKTTDTISLSIIIFDTVYIEWDRNKIFENLLLRYDLGIITASKDESYFETHKIYNFTFRCKCEAVAKRTILENFELREMVNELRDENFHLSNEIYELSDKLDRQMICINKLAATNGLQDCKPTIGNLSDEKLMNIIEYKISELATDYAVINDHVHDDELVNHLIMKYEIYNSDHQVESEDSDEKYGLQKKALMLVYRSVRENYVLRDMVHELRNRNWFLRNGIYAQEDKINRFVLLINKLERHPECGMNIDWKMYWNKRCELLGFGGGGSDIGIDWDKWHKISNKLVHGYVRQYIENEYNMIVPEGINPVIANYAIYIFRVMFI